MRYFKVLKQTLGGRVLLSSDSAEPVTRPKPLKLAGKRVGVVKETIGRVSDPIYVGELDRGVDFKALFGKKLESE